jgi:hypothetical protein
MLDSCIWLAGTPGYPLSETQKVIVDMIMEDEEGEGGVTHFDRPVLLPHDLENYEGTYIISPGRPGIPASLPSWSQADEKKILDSLILELNEKLLAGVDPDPNLSRSSKRPQLYPAFRSGCVESAAFVGGSNAKNLANAAANLGIDSYQLAKGGWKITRDNIEKLIPDLKELMSSLPAGTPIVLFCLDNSSFLAASEEGGLIPISKCVPEDDGYHVKGDLVVAPECALHHTVELLKKLVSEFSEYQLFFVTPITRYILGPCCDADDHVTNSGNPDFLSKILSDLTKLKFALRKQLSPATVLDGIELICGAGCGKDRMEQTLRSGWADPVHPKPHIYSKMALNLIEKVAAASTPAGSQKRKRSDSSEEGPSSRAPGPPSRGGQGSNNRNPTSRGGTSAAPAPQPRGSYRAANSASSLQSHQSWNPPRGRGQHQGRGEARGRGFPAERGRGNYRGGQPRRGWGRPWSRW